MTNDDDDDGCEVISLDSRRAPPPPPPPPPAERPPERFTITKDGTLIIHLRENTPVSTKLPITFHLHRELIDQLDRVVRERTAKAEAAIGSAPKITRAELIEEACWTLVRGTLTTERKPRKPKA